jgi:hypothetical protein
MQYAHLAQDASRIVLRNRDYAKLALWGLIKQKPNTDPKKRTSGIWRATSEGASFAWNLLSVPSHVFLASPGNQVLGWEEGKINVITALGKHFDYEELMKGLG